MSSLEVGLQQGRKLSGRAVNWWRCLWVAAMSPELNVSGGPVYYQF